MDKILINDLSARCIIGVWQDERVEKQDVLVNIAIGTDFSKAAKNDQFEDTLDYRAIKKKVLNLVESSKYYLLEALAEAISETCLDDNRVLEVTVRVEKPSALRFAKSVGIEINRKRRT
ncbi:MAG: dihydroneopterin aldolase [bacterium]